MNFVEPFSFTIADEDLEDLGTHLYSFDSSIKQEIGTHPDSQAIFPELGSFMRYPMNEDLKDDTHHTEEMMDK